MGAPCSLMPWHGQLLVGTTETRFRGDPAAVAPTAAELHYLLGVLKHYFPRLRAARRRTIYSRASRGCGCCRAAAVTRSIARARRC